MAFIKIKDASYIKRISGHKRLILVNGLFAINFIRELFVYTVP